MDIAVEENKIEKWKTFRSPTYNYSMRRSDGYFERWGRTPEEDPIMAPTPEILDLEISSGNCYSCGHCYKGNSQDKPTVNMSFETFRSIVNKFPNLTQIAFGITKLNSNPDFFEMMRYCRTKDIVPNFTMACWENPSDEEVQAIARTCGAVAISAYDLDKTLALAGRLRSAGMTQVNIHFVLSVESWSRAVDLLRHLGEDPYSYGIRAVVFLKYKPKGSNAGKLTPITDPERYKHLIEIAKRLGVGIGFDSCSAPVVLAAFADDEKMAKCVEPCESGLFSSYINVLGEFYPCSFCEGEPEWEKGIPLESVKSFQEIWNDVRVEKWRHRLLDNGRKCPIFKLDAGV
jgi:MoaA/NifB/PqqE/SkfB family radical SAM enzyme